VGFIQGCECPACHPDLQSCHDSADNKQRFVPLAFLVERMVHFSLSNPGAHEAYIVSWISLALTGLAFVIGLAVATTSNSSATLGFALENAVDGISSALVLWRFWGGGHSIPVAELELREKRASIGIAVAFVALAITVGGTASAHIAEHSVPSNVAALLGVSAPSVVVFAMLGSVKLHMGFATKSPSLKKDAACSLCGSLLSLGVCIGTAVAHEAWWFDAVVALLVSGALLLHACRSDRERHRERHREGRRLGRWRAWGGRGWGAGTRRDGVRARLGPGIHSDRTPREAWRLHASDCC
jgi:hypothetical protein